MSGCSRQDRKWSNSQIQIALSIERETHVRLLNHTTINTVQNRPISNLRFGKVLKEQVQVTWHVSLRSVLNDAVAVFGVCFVVDWKLVQGSEAVGRDVHVTVGKIVGWLVLLHKDVRSAGLKITVGLLCGRPDTYFWHPPTTSRRLPWSPRLSRSPTTATIGVGAALLNHQIFGSVLGHITSLELGVKMDSRVHEFNVLLEMSGNAVLLAGDVRLSGLVLVHVVPGLEKLLSLVDGGAELQPV
jgi:hypothetical protein